MWVCGSWSCSLLSSLSWEILFIITSDVFTAVYLLNISLLIMYKHLFQYTQNRLYSIGIVGSGPAGIYCSRFLKSLVNNVDVFDKSKFPYGLIRYGVAPDNSSLREGFYHNAVSLFTNMVHIKDINNLPFPTKNSSCRFIGEFLVTDDSLYEMRKRYNAVILAIGASAPKRSGIINSHLSGICTALEFIQWINNYYKYEKNMSDSDVIDYLKIKKTQSVKSIGILGYGNVALDLARMFIKSKLGFELQGINQKALQFMKDADVNNIYILGRRSLYDAAFTVPEFRELCNLENININFDKTELLRFEKSDNMTRPQKKIYEILKQKLNVPKDPTAITIHFISNANIQKYMGGEIENELKAIQLPNTTIDVDFFFESIGQTQPDNFKTLQLSKSKDKFLHSDYKILQPAPNLAPVYATGWCCTGPSGNVATTLANVTNVVNQIIKDFGLKID